MQGISGKIIKKRRRVKCILCQEFSLQSCFGLTMSLANKPPAFSDFLLSKSSKPYNSIIKDSHIYFSFMYHQPSTKNLPQHQEISIQGCCISTFLRQSHGISYSPSRVRVYSERKDSKEKKIDMTIAKRGHSNPKDSIIKESIQRVKSNIRESSIPISDGKYSLCASTKITASRNSLRTSQANLRCLRIEKSSEQFKNLPLSTNSTMRQLHETKPIEPVLQRNASNFNGISEIQIVAEDFVSQGSSTIKLVNALSQVLCRQTQERDPFVNLNNRQICNMNALSAKTPIKQPNSSNLQDRKRFQKPDPTKKRLVL